MKILRRLGTSPTQRGSTSGQNCPDLFELDSGDYAFIGTDRTDELDGKLPADASRADYERIVTIPRDLLVAAKRDIPDEAP